MNYLEYSTCVWFNHIIYLTDSEDLYTVAFQNILSRFGTDYTFELKQKLMGLQSLETAKTIIKELDLPMTVEEFLEESNKEFEKLFPDTQVLPGTLLL